MRLLAAAAFAAFLSSTNARSTACSADQESCAKPSVDACCVPSNGVLVLALQWLPGYCKSIKDRCAHDVLDRIPRGEWTIHGLWPDTCDGYQVGECDPRRAYADARRRIADSPILANMTRFWVTYKGGQPSDYNEFWSHEFSKHGTCYSPSNPECVGSKKGADVERFFMDTLYLRDKYNIFKALDAAKILPSNSAGYKAAEIVDALTSSFGMVSVGLICKGPYLTEIRLALKGIGAGIAKNHDLYLPGTCPRYGIIYAEEHPSHSENASPELIAQSD